MNTLKITELYTLFNGEVVRYMNYTSIKLVLKRKGVRAGKGKSEETGSGVKGRYCKHSRERGSKSGVHSLSRASRSEIYRDLKHACLACMKLWAYFTKYDIKTKPLNSPETKLINPLFSWAENNLFTETRTSRLLLNRIGHNLQQKC